MGVKKRREASADFRMGKLGMIILDIDAINMKRVVNGVDQLSAQRTAIGL